MRTVAQRKRLILADSYPLIAEACRHVLQPEFEVIAVVATGRDLVQATLSLNPDGVVLDVSLPQLNGLDAVEQIKRNRPYVKLVFLTTNLQPQVAAEAFRRGASGYLLKQSGTEEYLTGIRSVMRGRSYLSPLIARQTMEYLLRRPQENSLQAQVTPRQREILQLLAEGRRMKGVAAMLDISQSAVAFHKYGAIEKLGIKSNAELMRFAINHNLTSLQEDSAFAGSLEFVYSPPRTLDMKSA